MENFQFPLLTYRLEAQMFFREVASDLLTIVPWCGSLRNMFVSHTQSHVTLMALHEDFFGHTPGPTHATPQLRVGQRLLPQTLSLVRCDSTLGGLPSGLGTLCSGPACTSIFLTRVHQKYLCEIFLPPHKE